MRVFLYLATIVIANVVTAKFAPMKIGVFLIPYGTLFISLNFIFRDLVQNQWGKRKTYFIMLLALAVSAGISHLLKDTLWITFASAVSFVFSETLDAEVYSRTKWNMSTRIVFSGLISGVLDSSIFVVLGLSPIGADFVPWNMVWMAVLGQMLAKSLMQLIGYMPIKIHEMKKRKWNFIS